MRNILVLITILLSSSSVYCQFKYFQNIKGSVYNKDTEELLSNVSVYYQKDKTIGTTTDSLGHFSLLNTPLP